MSTEEEISLRVGTHVIGYDRDAYILGKIAKIEKDENGAYWFKCLKICRLDQPRIFEEEEYFNLSSSQFEESDAKLIDDAEFSRIFQHIKDMTQVAAADEREVEHSGEEAEYADGLEPDFDLENNVYTREPIRQDIDFPVDSGKTKTILELFNANPKRQWPLIDRIVNETGHLIFTTLSRNTITKILEHKVEWELTHIDLKLEVNTYYELTNHKGQSSVGKFIGDDYWVLSPENHNDIHELKGRKFGRIPQSFLSEYIVEKIDTSNFEALVGEIESTISNIRNLTHYNNVGDITVSVLSAKRSDKVLAEQLTLNWQKAFTYNYYKGMPLDPRLEVANFEEKEAIKKLAEYKGDQAILSQF
jgi:hypothetical protein